MKEFRQQFAWHRVLLVAAALLVVQDWLLPLPRINGRIAAFDTASGAVRETYYCFAVPFYRTTSKTWISSAVRSEKNETPRRNWRTVSRMGWLRDYSPQYRFGSILSHVYKLGHLATLAGVPEQRQLECSRRLLDLWHKDAIGESLEYMAQLDREWMALLKER